MLPTRDRKAIVGDYRCTACRSDRRYDTGEGEVGATVPRSLVPWVMRETNAIWERIGIEWNRQLNVDAREAVATVVQQIQRADYEGDRAALKHLHAELAPFIENRELASRVQYWRGFAMLST